MPSPPLHIATPCCTAADECAALPCPPPCSAFVAVPLRVVAMRCLSSSPLRGAVPPLVAALPPLSTSARCRRPSHQLAAVALLSTSTHRPCRHGSAIASADDCWALQCHSQSMPCHNSAPPCVALPPLVTVPGLAVALCLAASLCPGSSPPVQAVASRHCAVPSLNSSLLA